MRKILRSAPAVIRAEIEREGWTVEIGGKHARWVHPLGGESVFGSITPSDHRAWYKHLTQLRRVARKVRGEQITPGTEALK